MEIEEVLNNWSIDNPISVKKVETGLLNETYIVRTLDGLFVLQKLHPAVSIEGCTKNYFHVTQFLLKLSKTSQTILPTKNEMLWITTVDKFKWRLLKGVEGEVHTITPNTKIAFEAGKLLAEFHASVKNYNQNLEPTLPMFQYEKVLEKLLKYENQFLESKNKEVIEMFHILKQEFPKLLLPKNLPIQIIHTDPKISNFLFTNSGTGICMIDLDTIQKLSPLYDIGDCVRSLCGNQEDDANNTFDFIKYQEILNGYNSVEHTLTNKEKELIPQACKLIMLGLASRFLNDYIDDNYFGWDETRYNNRKEHDLARTIGQVSLWNSFIQQ